MHTKKSKAMKYLEKLAGGPLTMGNMLTALRQCEELSLNIFARRLKISPANLSDIEKGRKMVSPERAARFAKALGLCEAQFIEVAVQDELNKQGLDRYRVKIEAA